MTLPVPLAVRVGDQHVTQQVQALSFRREAIGGVRSISFNLARPLTDLDGLDPLSKVYVYDARTAQTIAEGRLADTGRTASADGERWDCVAFGPAQAMTDVTSPIVYIDRSISDGWQVVDVVHTEASVSTATRPGDTALSAPQGILEVIGEGIPLAAESRVVYRYNRMYEIGQELGGFLFEWDAHATAASWNIEAVTRTYTGGGEVAYTTTFNVAGANAMVYVTAGFPTGRNLIELRIRWSGGSGTTTGESWGWFTNVVIRPQLLRKDGTDRAAIDHGNSYILSHDVVEDILGRWGASFDGANATVDQAATFQIRQLAYTDGVNAEQVLADLMKMAPSHRWTTTPDTAGKGYGFRWEPWPTTVRYEATLDDGGSFPISTQSLFNAVSVRYKAPDGTTAARLRTKACPPLDDAGITRHTILDLGDEVGDPLNAEQAGDAFLADHNVPKNSGTLTVARPIRDVITGALVQPWEIEEGELVRVLGVEAYPDAFNASSNDGQGVFRIHAVDYTTEGNVATLALDSDPRETEDALVKLLKERDRR